MTEEIIKGEEYQKRLSKGINDTANAIKDTLGPLGRTVTIVNPFGEIVITKDGVSVAESIEMDPEKPESIGSNMVKEVAIKTNNLAGDGTTSASVLTQALYNKGAQKVGLGFKPNLIKKGMKSALVDVLREVEAQKKEVKQGEMVKFVAKVSSNGDEKLAETISNIYEELGVNAVISISQGSKSYPEVNIVEGMQFDRGYLSPYSVTNKVKMKVDFQDALIFIYDGKINRAKTILPLLEQCSSQDKPLVIIAEDVQETALAALQVNHLRGFLQSAVVMSPGYGNKRSQRLQDMAVLFDAIVYNKESEWENFSIEHLGRCEKVEITSTDTALIGGAGVKEAIEKRVGFIKEQLAHHEGNKYEVDILEERLGKLSGGVASLKIGAFSKEEGKEILDRAEDCKNAVKAALLEGIVPGGGVALLNASNILMAKSFKSDLKEDIKQGYLVVLEAVREPFRQILTNASLKVDLIEDGLKIGSDYKGYDVLKEEFTKDMESLGIIDPYKVVRVGLESSVSVVSTLLTSNFAVINKADSTTTKFS